MEKKYVHCGLIGILIICVSALFISCAEGPLEEETTTTTGGTTSISSIEVSANPTSVAADGASGSTITVTVKSSTNQAVPDVEVTFETTRGSIAYVDSEGNITDEDTDERGEVVTTLTSDRYNDSNVTVTAKCQGVEGTATISFTGIDLSLVANPDNLLAGGSASSTITATLKDAAGNTMPNVTIGFSTDRGELNQSSVITGTSGTADVSLTCSESGTATVTATSSGATATATVNFTRYLFTLGASPTTIRVGESSTITATLYDSGALISTGETIDFSSSLGTLSSYQEVTSNGTASTTLTAAAQTGIATIDADVTVASTSTALSAKTQVSVIGGDAAKIVLFSDPNVISANTGEATITATVYDANDQPAGNQKIYFRITEGPGGGEYLSASNKTTSSAGVATVTLYAGSLESTLGGVKVEANTESDFSGSSGLTSLTIAGLVANIGVGIDLHELTPVGGHLEVKVSAIATDVNGNPVPDGTTVNFSVTAMEFDEDRDYDLTINCWDANLIPLTCATYYTPGAINPIILQGTLGVTWFTDDVNLNGTLGMAETEDANGNGILDTGEDKNGNGVIDPVNSCVVSSNIETANGVAATTMSYLQPHAANIKVRISAEAGGVSGFYETVLLCTEDMVDNGTCGIGY